MCGQDVEFMNVKPGGSYSKQELENINLSKVRIAKVDF
jgi:hypothetical protein